MCLDACPLYDVSLNWMMVGGGTEELDSHDEEEVWTCYCMCFSCLILVAGIGIFLSQFASSSYQLIYWLICFLTALSPMLEMDTVPPGLVCVSELENDNKNHAVRFLKYDKDFDDQQIEEVLDLLRRF